MRIIIATTHVPFERGGAEILAEDLLCAITAQGHDVEIVALPWKWHPSQNLLFHMASSRMFDLTQSGGRPIDLMIGMKFPAYLIPHPNKVLWVVHQQRSAYELWDDYYGLSQDPRGAMVRDVIQRADRAAVAESRGVFTIAKNVSNRLERYLGVDSTPIYPPPRLAAELHCAEDSDYLFFPGRVSPTKRHDLVLRALALTQQQIRLRIAGSGESEDYEREILRLVGELELGDRVDFVGWVDERELVEGYAHCRGVVFPPRDEDYGYVTLEGMLASKPVVTCTDSGEPLEFVVDGETGLVAEPEPAALARALDALWQNRNAAREWGRAGRKKYDGLGISWERVLDSLIA